MSIDTEAVVNVEQAEAWDGPEGERWTAYADRYDRATRRHRDHLVSAGVVRSGDTVLDIGCGTGGLTRDVVRTAHAGAALGVDLSARMLDRAREITAAEGLRNVSYEQADAQTHRFQEAGVDVAVSSFGASFFGDSVAAFTNIARAVRPGGRLALLSWRELDRNEWVTALRAALAAGRSLPEPPSGIPGPFGLADPDGIHRVLDEAGFTAIDVAPVEEVVDYGPDPAGAYEFICGMGIVIGLTRDLDTDDRSSALDRLHATVVAHETAEGVLFGSSAWLVTARHL
jgi:SAM-dependent methyltransferase